MTKQERAKQEKLIQFYTNRLERLIEAYGNSINQMAAQEYIEQAKRDLEEVKAGRTW